MHANISDVYDGLYLKLLSYVARPGDPTVRSPRCETDSLHLKAWHKSPRTPRKVYIRCKGNSYFLVLRRCLLWCAHEWLIYPMIRRTDCLTVKQLDIRAHTRIRYAFKQTIRYLNQGLDMPSSQMKASGRLYSQMPIYWCSVMSRAFCFKQFHRSLIFVGFHSRHKSAAAMANRLKIGVLARLLLTFANIIPIVVPFVPLFLSDGDSCVHFSERPQPISLFPKTPVAFYWCRSCKIRAIKIFLLY